MPRVRLIQLTAGFRTPAAWASTRSWVQRTREEETAHRFGKDSPTMGAHALLVQRNYQPVRAPLLRNGRGARAAYRKRQALLPLRGAARLDGQVQTPRASEGHFESSTNMALELRVMLWTDSYQAPASYMGSRPTPLNQLPNVMLPHATGLYQAVAEAQGVC